VKKPHKVKASSNLDNPEQYRRFVETARELGADESPDAMDKAFERVDVRQKPKDKKPPKDG
jgi:hypothetical protein